MPYLSDKILLPKKLDRRLKLTDEQKEEIRELRKTHSYNHLAKQFNVSKRLIIFVCNPNSLEECKKRRKERGGSAIYYNKKRNTDAIRKWRRYKHELYLENKITN